MRRLAGMLAVSVLAAGMAAAAWGQPAVATARIGFGQSAQATATPVPGDGVLLEIALPSGRAQSFPQLGVEIVPLSGRAGDHGLIARDLNGDGVDEIIIRGSVPPKAGAVLVFRWDHAVGEFVPVEFTNDRDETTKYLVVDPALPVLIHESGIIEAQYETARPDGRKSYHVARYRWTENGYSHTSDN